MTDMRPSTIAVCLLLFLGIGIAFGASDDMAGMPGMNGAIDNTTKPSSTMASNNTSMGNGMCMMKNGNCMMSDNNTSMGNGMCMMKSGNCMMSDNNTSMMNGICMMKNGNCMMSNGMSGNSSPEMKNMGMNGQGMMKKGGMMSCCRM